MSNTASGAPTSPQRALRNSVLRVLAQRPAAIALRPVERILIMRPDHLGDLLFATPALRRLREAFPRARIEGLVGPWGRPAWEHDPSLDALRSLDFPGIVARAKRPWQPYTMLLGAARELRERNYDLVVVLRFDYWWGALLAARAGIPAIWGYDLPELRPFLTASLPYTPGRHEVEQNMALVEAVIAAAASGSLPLPRNSLGKAKPTPVDRAAGRPPLAFTVPQADQQWAAKYRAAAPIVIHPGTNFSLKLWTLDGWARVAEQLAAAGRPLLFTGSRGEGELIEAIRLRMDPKLRLGSENLAGETTFSRLAALLAAAKLVLGVDSGPLHLAEAVGTSTIRLYGPSDEQVWGPWGPQALHTIIRAPGTQPGFFLDPTRQELEGGAEMKAIAPEQVIAAVEQALARNA